MDEVEVVVAHRERATLRVGDVFLKVDGDPDRTAVEVAAMALAPVPTPQVLWCTPPVLALAAVSGTPLARLGHPSTSPPAAWAAAGAVVRQLHDAPLPPWTAPDADAVAERLDRECAWIAAHDVLPPDLVRRNRDVAQSVFRAWTPVFTHGDLQPGHVVVQDGEVAGVLDWSEAARGDAAFDLAVLTLGFEEHLPAVLDGYGGDVDVDAVRGWWSWRSLTAIPWLVQHGFDPFAPGCEVDVLRRGA